MDNMDRTESFRVQLRALASPACHESHLAWAWGVCEGRLE
jgi:hypothetical protein